TLIEEVQNMLHQKKKVGARIDTKLKPNSAQKVMGLAVTSLLENSKTNKSGNSNNDMKLFLHHKVYPILYY
ncbi:11917_t:CDS:1, partial [Rhizophagus irregularis]